MLDVESSLCKIIFTIVGKSQGRSSPKDQKRVFGLISETNSRRVGTGVKM